MAMMLLGGRAVGPGAPVYLVAELSGNHGGSFDRAVALLEAAKGSGADAVKTQAYTPEAMTIDSHERPFVISGTVWDGRSLFDLYREAMTPWEWQPKLKAIADDLGMDFVVSVFDAASIEHLESIGPAAYKIASFENGDLELLRSVCSTGRPTIISTGTATMSEVDDAVATARTAGCRELALLWCVSAYPAPIQSMNLRTIDLLSKRFDVPVGLSDHTLSETVAVAAVAAGATIIEKHMTLSRDDGGPDAAFSVEPEEFSRMAQEVRVAEAALGDARLPEADEDIPGREFRRSLYIVRDVRAGETLSAQSVRAIRPSGGLAPRHIDAILGSSATRDLHKGEPVSWEMIGKSPEDNEQTR